MLYICSGTAYIFQQLAAFGVFLQFRVVIIIIKTSSTGPVIDFEFLHAKSKCYLKTSIMIIIGEQSSK